MSIRTYDLSVVVFRRHLVALRTLIDRGRAFAAERKFDPNKFVDLRLAVDMLPFSAQVVIACDLAKNGAGRLAGIERPTFEGTPATLEDLQTRIDRVVAYLDTIDPSAMAGVEDRSVTYPSGGEDHTVSGLDYLRTFVLPNFFFHCTTTYALLRHAGVPLGKRDFIGE